MTTMTKILATAVLLAACSKNDPAPVHDRGASVPATPSPQAAAATAATPATPAAATPAAATPDPAGTAIPTPEDYEATAAKTITAENVDAQLDALEKEIAATPK